MPGSDHDRVNVVRLLAHTETCVREAVGGAPTAAQQGRIRSVSFCFYKAVHDPQPWRSSVAESRGKKKFTEKGRFLAWVLLERLQLFDLLLVPICPVMQYLAWLQTTLTELPAGPETEILRGRLLATRQAFFQHHHQQQRKQDGMAVLAPTSTDHRSRDMGERKTPDVAHLSAGNEAYTTTDEVGLRRRHRKVEYSPSVRHEDIQVWSH